ncbi:MAG TPA: hybrid sensor histidine kinase/response regulator [Desulfobulbaceae bacterium]|nr:hybrid sensor histidine kinase/response regulator [Desulfobulbaceae bacterium]
MFESKVKILLIDDRPENLHAMKMTLQPLEGVEVYTTQSGNDGLALMLEHDFAVVLLDVQMPGMDGFETAALMQDHKVTRNIPIIFITAISKEDANVFKGYRSGAVDYLFKPINPDILLSKVQVFVKLYRQRLECERMQQELQKVKNLDALGVLAGGIAHDFNNLLTTIFGYIELAQMLSGPQSEIHEKLDEAMNAAQRAKQLTEQLLTFSKGGRPMTETADVTQLLTDTTSLLLSGSNVKVHIDIAGPISDVVVDKGQICQVFQNLLFNAREAMPHGGDLTIRVENIDMDGEGLGPLAKEGRYVMISFRDSGPGIDPAILGKIFDPYFSSKKMGPVKGQGLGLAIAHSIIKKHNGYIFAKSKAGEGAVFTIYLPVSAQVATVAKKSSTEVGPSIVPPPAGLERILVMEDEKSVAGAMCEMLKFLGYECTLAVNGPEAIEYFAQATEMKCPYAAVILDLTIRGGEGADKVFAELRKLDPEIKAIVASGYADNYIMANYKSCGFSGAISKPFSISVLAAALENIH